MTYEELVQKVKTGTSRMDAKKITDHLAVQVNIEGEAEGAFYIEMNQGSIVVEPYEYYDRDVLLICQATQILDILGGKLDPMAALSDGQIRAEGNVGRLGLLGEIIKKTPAKRGTSSAKKTAEEKKPAAKSAAKASSAKKPAAKSAAKASSAKKPAAKSATKTTAARKTSSAASKTTTKSSATSRSAGK